MWEPNKTFERTFQKQNNIKGFKRQPTFCVTSFLRNKHFASIFPLLSRTNELIMQNWFLRPGCSSSFDQSCPGYGYHRHAKLNKWVFCCNVGRALQTKWPSLGWLHITVEASLLPPCSPEFESRLRRDFFSLLLSLWTVLRSNPSSAKQWFSQM